MRDIKEVLLPNEEVKYQYTHPLWMKIMAGLSCLVMVYFLYIDIPAGRGFLVLMEAAMMIYMGYWLVTLVRDRGLYLITDRRVLRLGAGPEEDQSILLDDVSDASIQRDTMFGSIFIRVEAGEQDALRLPVSPSYRAKPEKLAEMIKPASAAAAPEAAAAAVPGEPEK